MDSRVAISTRNVAGLVLAVSVPWGAAAPAAFLEEIGYGSGWLDNMREAEEAEGARWWWHRFDRVWLPFALTGYAVHHYVEALRGLAANPYGEPDAVTSGSFEYRARVEYSEEQPVVHLFAKWYNYCGSACALGFTHERRVYFDPAGVIQRVEGDQAPHYWVS